MATPFVGTNSYRTLLEWIYRMDLDVSLISTVNAHDLSGEPTKGFRMAVDSVRAAPATKIITLGQNAATRLVELQEAYLHHLQVFQLPHPSGLNREVNDKAKISGLLTRCKAFVYKP